MGLLNTLMSFVHNNNNNKSRDKRSRYIFYKIVDRSGDKALSLQCINTNGIFRASIKDIVLDLDILHGLHPVQACFIGIEYAKELKTQHSHRELKRLQKIDFNKHNTHRYGVYHLLYQNRKGKLGFIHTLSQKESVMDPRDIALSERLISEFDAAQTFYIGLSAGIKLHNPTEEKNEQGCHSYLKLVKA